MFWPLQFPCFSGAAREPPNTSSNSKSTHPIFTTWEDKCTTMQNNNNLYGRKRLSGINNAQKDNGYTVIRKRGVTIQEQADLSTRILDQDYGSILHSQCNCKTLSRSDSPRYSASALPINSLGDDSVYGEYDDNDDISTTQFNMDGETPDSNDFKGIISPSREKTRVMDGDEAALSQFHYLDTKTSNKCLDNSPDEGFTELETEHGDPEPCEKPSDKSDVNKVVNHSFYKETISGVYNPFKENQLKQAQLRKKQLEEEMQNLLLDDHDDIILQQDLWRQRRARRIYGIMDDIHDEIRDLPFNLPPPTQPIAISMHRRV